MGHFFEKRILTAALGIVMVLGFLASFRLSVDNMSRIWDIS
jgi:hypothetical protein